MSIIQTKDVKKWFGDFQALKGISMDVAEGEVLVICGPVSYTHLRAHET